MKKIFYFMFAVMLCSAFMGCTKEEGNQDGEAKKLIGTWVGYDGTPGLEWTDKYTLTFYSSGKATEVCS